MEDMIDEQEQSSITKIKDILPILWSSYEHMYEARETGTTNGINFLMIVTAPLGLLPLRNLK